MKNVVWLRLCKCLVFVPMAALVCVILNLVLYALALSGIIVLRESPWHYAARELYVYHGRAILQFERGCMEYDKHLLYRPRNGVFPFNNFEFQTTIGTIDGQRRNPYLDAPPELVILGDSFAQGWGVNDEDTVASVLTRDFGISTLSSGVSSYNTARELSSFRRALETGTMPRPLHVVIFYCTNDFEENVYYLRHGTKNYTQENFDVQVGRATNNTAKSNLFIASLPKHISSIKDGYSKWLSIFRKDLDYGNLYDPAPPVSLVEQTSAFKAVLNANLDILDGIHIIVVAFKGWGGRDQIGAVLAEMPALANNARVSVIVNTVPNSGYFPLDGHLNESGNRYLAGLIAKRIVRIEPAPNTTAHD